MIGGPSGLCIVPLGTTAGDAEARDDLDRWTTSPQHTGRDGEETFHRWEGQWRAPEIYGLGTNGGVWPCVNRSAGGQVGSPEPILPALCPVQMTESGVLLDSPF